MSHSIKLKLPKTFLMKVHTHPLITDFEGESATNPDYQDLWEAHPDMIDFHFGGVNNDQFKNAEQAKDFLNEFKALVDKSQLVGHQAQLLYIMAFQYMDIERQSIKNNKVNSLNASGQFLLNLYINGLEHVAKMNLNKNYFPVTDTLHNRRFFSEKDPAVYKDAEVHYTAGMVQYIQLRIGKSVILIPDDINFATVNTVDKAVIDHLPVQYRYEAIRHTILQIIQDHIDANSEYYQLFMEGSDDTRRLRTFYTQNSNILNDDATLVRIGRVLQDYLHHICPTMTKTSMAEFLWEYFCLFKFHKINRTALAPDDYSQLKQFYKEHQVNKATIRDKFKGYVITGHF